MVTTFAGSTGVSGKLDGTGTAAQFAAPIGIASDGKGNLFVADFTDHTIRKIVIATAAVTTLAGSPGISGSTDGVGNAATFLHPIDVATDGAGDLFVIERDNSILRRVAVETGAVTTFAGSPQSRGNVDGEGNSARFGSPNGVSSDGIGNLFVADSSNHTLRRVVIRTGVVSTFAGSPPSPGDIDGTGQEARFNQPHGMASDGAGNLFVADVSNHVIRRVSLATGAVTTLAGSSGQFGGTDGTGAAARFRVPVDLAHDGLGDLFVTDYYNNAVRRIVIATAMVTTLAGLPGSMLGHIDGTGTDARFFYPMGVTGDGGGNLFVTESGNHTIRKVEVASGGVTTLAGSGTSGSVDGTGTSEELGTPSGIATDGAGNLFVADTNTHTLRRIEIATGAVTTFAGMANASGSTDGTGSMARFHQPRGIAIDKAGNLFVADSENHSIRRIDVATQAVTTVVGTPDRLGVVLGALPAGLSCPLGLAWGPSGELLITDGDEHAILAAHF